jgi:hypothetical protein
MTPYPRFVARQYGPNYATPIRGGSFKARLFDFYILDRAYCWQVVWHRSAFLAQPWRLLQVRREWRRKFHELNGRDKWTA